MLFFDQEQLAAMRETFRQEKWPDYYEPYLMQPAPATVASEEEDYYSYEVMRFEGTDWATIQTGDLKYGVWIITENAVAYALSDETRHLEHAHAWVKAFLAASPGWPDARGKAQNTDLYYGNIAYALAMFLDLCGNAITPDERAAIVVHLQEQIRRGREFFGTVKPEHTRYTQNHFFIPFVGFLCACFALRDEDPTIDPLLDKVAPFVPLIVEGLGHDGYYFEGLGYANYSYIWLIHMVDLWEKHRGEDYFGAPCFANLGHFFRWMMYPEGKEYFWASNDSEKPCRFNSWAEYRNRTGLRNDVVTQNFSHLLYRIALATGDDSNRRIANDVRARGIRWIEGFWALAWDGPDGDLPDETEHIFDDHGVFFCDTEAAGKNLRVMARCGPPVGHSLPMHGDVPAYQCDVGHVHGDCGVVYAAVGETPVFIGPGYLARKFGVFQSTFTFDGQGQGQDHLWSPFGCEYNDYSRLMKITMHRQEGPTPGVIMDATAAYRPDLGVTLAQRTLSCPGDGFILKDALATAAPSLLEARFRIPDAPLEVTDTSVIWELGNYRFTLSIADASEPVRFYCSPGHVITVNMRERPGLFAEGIMAQRGYVIALRPPAKVTDITWTLKLSVEATQ